MMLISRVFWTHKINYRLKQENRIRPSSYSGKQWKGSDVGKYRTSHVPNLTFVFYRLGHLFNSCPGPLSTRTDLKRRLSPIKAANIIRF